MADVARLAGVSPKTVSRVVNDAPNVRDSVRARVNEAIVQLGFRPNAAARALASQRSRVIGIVSLGSSLYGPSEQLFGLERCIREAGYSAEIVTTAGGSHQEIIAATDRLLTHGVDGIALAAPLADVDLGAPEFRSVPCVAVGDPVPAPAHLRIVACDQRTGARRAVEHLLGLGHDTVHHVSGPPSWASSQAREDGWRQALTDAGRPCPAPLRGDWTPRSGYEAGRMLAERPDVTAVFVANDHMATGLLRAMWESGRRVPADVSVVGFDDAPESEFLFAPLTTVRQPFRDITSEAVTELVATMVGDAFAAPETLVLPVELVVRASSGPPRSPARTDGVDRRPERHDHQHQGVR
jgi:DNA-binding LacI/PurR family transcriptional regulator